MNFVGNDRQRVNHETVFEFLCTCERRRVWVWLLSLFIDKFIRPRTESTNKVRK